MKIVAICGSPHKGSCYQVLSTIAEDHPEVEYKLLMLGELNFGQCIGCYACIARGEDKCPLKDDRDLVVNEMLDADGVIFASPVYVNHISALMKSFIDRIGYESHRPRFFGKQAMVMAVVICWEPISRQETPIHCARSIASRLGGDPVTSPTDCPGYPRQPHDADLTVRHHEPQARAGRGHRG